jgi:hypothetical protein
MLTPDQRDVLLSQRPAERVTRESIQAKVMKTDFLNVGLLTICVVTLENGFSVRGESACAHPDNYDRALGERIAYDDAIAKIWPLEGYLLKQRLWEAEQAHRDIDR